MSTTFPATMRRRWRRSAVAALSLVGLVAVSPQPATASTDTGACQAVVQNSLVNPGFESPAISARSYRIMPEASLTGWHTTASDHMVEVWSTGFNGVPSTQGNQFAELNANMVGMLYQDVATIPGTTITWRLAHRGRSGVDKMDVKVGPPTGTLLSQSGGVGYSDGNTAWVFHGGTYVVPAGQTLTRFGFDSITSVGGVSYGNFLDVTDFGVTTLLACPDSATTRTATAVSGNVLANDVSAGTKSVSANTQPSHGTVTVASNGAYTYTPAAGYTGADTFNYTLTDGAGATATTSVTVSVTALALPSFTTSSDTITVVGGGPLVPGATVQVAITKTNTGTDTATGAVVRESVPAGCTYVPGSLAVTAGTNTPTGSLTDAAGDDRGFWTGGTVAVNVGAGATATTGGSLPPGASVTVTYRLTVGAVPAAPLALVSNLDYVAQQLNRSTTDAAAPLALVATAPVSAPAATTTTTAGSTAAPTTAAPTTDPLSAFRFLDAGLGAGATCPATLNEDRLPAVNVTDVEAYSSPTTILNGPITARDWEALSGNWLIHSGAYTQENTCGFDYTTLYTGHALEHFTYAVTFKAGATNQGGIVFNQSSPTTRSNASVVDLTDNGATLRWGHYDQAGYYRNDGTQAIPAVAAGQAVTLAVTVHGTSAAISFNGAPVGTMTNPNPRGYVGLVTTKSKVDFTAINLTGIPAA